MLLLSDIPDKGIFKLFSRLVLICVTDSNSNNALIEVHCKQYIYDQVLQEKEKERERVKEKEKEKTHK